MNTLQYFLNRFTDANKTKDISGYTIETAKKLFTDGYLYQRI